MQEVKLTTLKPWLASYMVVCRPEDADRLDNSPTMRLVFRLILSSAALKTNQSHIRIRLASSPDEAEGWCSKLGQARVVE